MCIDNGFHLLRVGNLLKDGEYFEIVSSFGQHFCLFECDVAGPASVESFLEDNARFGGIQCGFIGIFSKL